MDQIQKYLAYLNTASSNSTRLKTALPAVKEGGKKSRKSPKTADQMKTEKDEGGFKSTLEKNVCCSFNLCRERGKRKQHSRDLKSDLLGPTR